MIGIVLAKRYIPTKNDKAYMKYAVEIKRSVNNVTYTDVIIATSASLKIKVVPGDEVYIKYDKERRSFNVMTKVIRKEQTADAD